MSNDEGNPAGDSLGALVGLREQLGRHEPVLRSAAETEIEARGGGYHILHVRAADRACVIEADGAGLFHAAFTWDDRPLFASQFEEPKPLAHLLRRWITDRAMPSVIHSEFPDLEIDKLAEYFERGIPLEGEFIRSWDALEQFFKEDDGNYFEAARAFIRALREAGYDRRLRAGQSMSIMGLSRSREQGLRDDQPRLWFAFNRDDMDIDANYGSGAAKGQAIELTEEVRQLLDELAATELA